MGFYPVVGWSDCGGGCVGWGSLIVFLWGLSVCFFLAHAGCCGCFSVGLNGVFMGGRGGGLGVVSFGMW